MQIRVMAIAILTWQAGRKIDKYSDFFLLLPPNMSTLFPIGHTQGQVRGHGHLLIQGPEILVSLERELGGKEWRLTLKICSMHIFSAPS